MVFSQGQAQRATDWSCYGVIIWRPCRAIAQADLCTLDLREGNPAFPGVCLMAVGMKH